MPGSLLGWLSAAVVAWLVAAALAPAGRWRWAVPTQAGAMVIGGIAALVAGLAVAIGSSGPTLVLGDHVVGAMVFHVTPIAGVFLALLGLVSLTTAAWGGRTHARSLGSTVYLATLSLAELATLAVLCADSVTAFLVCWESMTLICTLVVLRYYDRREAARGGLLFSVLGEVGFVCVTASLVLLATQAHSLDFTAIAVRAASIAAPWRGAAFVLALVGFGFKAGLVPFHISVPEADPAPPADGSAFLSAVTAQMGIYGIILVGVRLLPHGPAWWGLLTMSLGAISALLGVLYALMERDWKRFLAYSTIENVGIAVTAIGAAMTFSSFGQLGLGALLLIAGLYHVLNHGTAKSLIFLSAGTIERVTGLRDLDRLGGLARRMPRTAIVTLVGTLALAALPPLNGFVGEWLIFQGLFQGFRLPSHLVGILIVAAGAVLALAGGLAINAFIRAYGIPFLGMARSDAAAGATEGGQPALAGVILAAVCGALALGAPLVLTGLDRVVRRTIGVTFLRRLLVPGLAVIPAHTNFSSLSPTYLAATLVALLAVPLLIIRMSRPRAATRRVPVWAGGILRYRPRMQYTATTHANPVRVTFDGVYRPHREVARASDDDPAGRSGPVHYRSRVLPVFERYLYQPVVRVVENAARSVRWIQAGDVNLYLLFVFLTILVAYAAAGR